MSRIVTGIMILMSNMGLWPIFSVLGQYPAVLRDYPSVALGTEPIFHCTLSGLYGLAFS